MFLSLQQRYILDLLHQLHYARTDQLHTLVQERYRAALPGYTRARTDAMLRQLRGCIPYFRIQNDIASLSPVEPDPLYLVAIDVMLTLSEGRPQGVARSTRCAPDAVLCLGPGASASVYCSPVGRFHSRRSGSGEPGSSGAHPLADPIQYRPGWLSLPLNQFLVIRQPDGTHRFYGPSTEHT